MQFLRSAQQPIGGILSVRGVKKRKEEESKEREWIQQGITIHPKVTSVLHSYDYNITKITKKFGFILRY